MSITNKAPTRGTAGDGAAAVAHSLTWNKAGESHAAESSDRRSSVRYAAAYTRVMVSWLHDGVRESMPGELRDISYGGVLLSVEQLPPESETLWITMALERAGSDEWVEILPLEARPERRGRFVLRARFPDGCPYEMFRTAAWGPGTIPESSLPAPEVDTEN